jgi:hypothetical protein
VSELASALIGRHVGPVLVCGGAPCLPSDLEVLRHGGFGLAHAVIVSGNEHAVYAGMAPDYISVNDDVHTVLHTHQEPRLRKLAPYAKLLSRHWWADYRYPKMIKANSGLTGVVWALLMGANPIITAGFEMYRGKNCYFHDRYAAESPSMSRPDDFMSRQIDALKDLLQDAPLRAVSGPLARAFGKWDPAETFAPRKQTALEERVASEKPRRMMAMTTTGWDQSMIPRGGIVAATEREATEAARFGFIDVTDKDPSQAKIEHYEALRRRHLRILGLIAKVRRHPRSVRRGIYDEDLARLVEWVEEGQTPKEISKRTGLPLEQVNFLIRTMGVENEIGKALGRDEADLPQSRDGASPN